uniref:EF-hand domain-containing protein n=1 Tax=Lotharella oceanica TaxID=641309 RepID=A0A7S2TV84_9EUKA
MGACSSSTNAGEDGVGASSPANKDVEPKSSDKQRAEKKGSPEIPNLAMSTKDMTDRLTKNQLKIVDEFYHLFDKDKDGHITAESLAKLNTSPREEISKLFGMTNDDIGTMSKDEMVKVFQNAKLSLCNEAGAENGTVFITEMLTVLLRVTKGEMSDEEGNQYLARKSKELNLATESMLTPSSTSRRS